MGLPRIQFSTWKRWDDRQTLNHAELQGVYLLAHFKTPPKGKADPQSREVIYIGETCAQSLKKRWRQFHRSAFGGRKLHSGGETYGLEFGGRRRQSLFVTAFPVDIENDTLRPLFIRHLERKLILDYALRWGAPPICNKK